MNKKQDFSWIKNPMEDFFEGGVITACTSYCYDYCVKNYCLCYGDSGKIVPE